MRLHHLNCISSCPLGGRLMDGRSSGVLQRGALCCHCQLLETDRGLVLVDTGFGLADVAAPRQRLSGFFLRMLSPDFREEMTAVRQIEELGFAAADVRHIVLTHLDFDHAGGLDDFPHATVHLLRQEADDAVAQRSWLDRQRFRPQQWRDRSRWRVYGGVGAAAAGSAGSRGSVGSPGGERWHGFDGVRQPDGLPPEILMVPLAGHTLGHAGVAMRVDGHWLLQAGDAYFHHREMAAEPWCTPGLRAYQTLMEKDRGARLANQERLRRLRQTAAADVTIFCAHDPVEFEALAGRSMAAPAGSSGSAPRREAGRITEGQAQAGTVS